MVQKLLAFLLVCLTCTLFAASPASADMDASFKAKVTSSGPQDYGTSSYQTLTLTSCGSTDVIVNRVDLNGQNISAQCTNVKLPCKMPPNASLTFKLPANTPMREIVVHTEGGPLVMRSK